MGDEKSFFHEGKIARHLREEDELGRVRLFEKKKKKKKSNILTLILLAFYGNYFPQRPLRSPPDVCC